MRRTLFALLATAALVAIAWAQANNSNTWQTPGNQTVGGAVQLCPRAADNIAVPCNNTAVNGAGFPAGATPIAATAVGTTGAISVTLAAAAGKTTYICGYYVSGNATAAAQGSFSVANTITTNMFSVIFFPANTTGIGTNTQTFTPCIPANAANTTIVVGSPAAGAGGQQAGYAWGFQL